MARRKMNRWKAAGIVVGVVLALAIVVLAVVFSDLTMTKDFYGLRLQNNIFSRNVSLEEVEAFLSQDKTREHEIIPYSHKPDETIKVFVSSGYRCLNFAVDLHNNSEKFGIRCAVVSLSTGHVINAFYTTDRGMVYADAWANSASVSFYNSEMGKVVIPKCNYRPSDNSTVLTWTEFIDTDNEEIVW